jgi:ATP synthase, F0 subunit b
MNLDIKELLLPNIWTFLTQLGATAVLFFVAKKFLWKPVQNMLDQRAKLLQEKLTEVDKEKEGLEFLMKDATSQVVEAKKKADEIIGQAVLDAEEIKKEASTEAAEDARVKLEKLQEDMAYEQLKLRENMYNEVVEISMEVATKLLSEKMNEKEDRKAVERFIAEMKKR